MGSKSSKSKDIPLEIITCNITQSQRCHFSAITTGIADVENLTLSMNLEKMLHTYPEWNSQDLIVQIIGDNGWWSGRGISPNDSKSLNIGIKFTECCGPSFIILMNGSTTKSGTYHLSDFKKISIPKSD